MFSSHLSFLLHSDSNFFRLVKLLAVVDKRTKQMIKVMDKRRGADGVIDMSEIIRHWAYDLMVRK